MEINHITEATNPETPTERLWELAHQGNDLARAVAQNPSAPPALLEKLAKSMDLQVLAALCLNPNTPKKLLFRLAARHPEKFLENPALPLILLESPDVLQRELSADAVRALLRIPKCASMIRQIASHHQDMMARYEVARDPKTPREILLSMKSESSWMVRDAFLQNPNTPEEIVGRLLDNEGEQLRKQALKHPNAPKEKIDLLRRAGASEDLSKATSAPQPLTQEERALLRHGDVFSRQLLALHPDTTHEELLLLVEDESSTVRGAVASSAKLDDALLQKLKRKEHSTHYGLCQNPKTPPEILNELLSDNSISSMRILAKNPNLSEASLRILLVQEEREIRLLAAAHPNCPKDLIALLRRLGANESLSGFGTPEKSISVEELRELAQGGPYLKMLVARHPNTPRDLLFQLVKLPHTEDRSGSIAGVVLSNTNTPPSFFLELSHSYSSVTRAMGRHTNTPPELLGYFIEGPDREARGSAAWNRNAPLDALRLLWRAGASPDLDSIVSEGAPDMTEEEFLYLYQRGPFARELAARNPKCPVPILEELAKRNDYWLSVALAQNPGATESVIRALKNHGTDIVQKLVFHPNTPSDVLLSFVGNYLHGVLFGVAKHKSTPPEALEKLSTNDSRRVRDAVAVHPRTPQVVLRWLSLEPRLSLRLSLAQNPSTPTDVLDRLLLCETPKVRAAAIQNKALPPTMRESLQQAGASSDLSSFAPFDPSLSSEVLAHLASCGPFGVLLAARHPGTSPTLLAALSKEAKKPVRLLLAENPSTPQEILWELGASLNTKQRERTLLNPNVPPRLRALLEKGSSEGPPQTPWEKLLTARSEAATPEELQPLLHTEELQVREAIAQNRNTTPDLLQSLSADLVYLVRCAVAQHPNITPEILEKLSCDKHKQVKRKVAQHPKTPPEVLAKLSSDKDPNVRRAVVKNPNTPKESKERLANDPKRRVRDQSRREKSSVA